jgi:hypothetical protein
MKRTIEISASFTGTIPTGNYENEKPMFHAKETLDLDQDFMADQVENIHTFVNDLIIERQKQLHEICYAQFKRHAEVSFQERLAKTYRNIRFYDGKDGVKYPSVTSIINWDKDFYLPPDELKQYASRGTIIHKQVEIFLQTGEWKEPKDIPEIYPDLVIVKRGNLGLAYDDVSFQGFYKDYPFKVIGLEDTLLNHDLKYGGRRDIKCVIESENKGKWEKVEGVLFDVPTILDVKTGTSLDKTSGFKQQTAYWNCDDEVQQVGLIHLTKDNKCGYAKPSLLQDKEKYWHLFLKDLENFNNRYGL